jgi:hypothetical protein
MFIVDRGYWKAANTEHSSNNVLLHKVTEKAHLRVPDRNCTNKTEKNIRAGKWRGNENGNTYVVSACFVRKRLGPTY